MDEREGLFPADPGDLTPADVRNHRFPKRMTGYDPEQVHLFLETVAERMERLLRENEDLKLKVAELSAEVTRLQKIEDLMRETLEMAKQKAQEYREKALEEASRIREQARREAEKIIADSRQQSAALREEIQHLKNQKKAIVEDLKTLAREILGLAEAFERGHREKTR